MEARFSAGCARLGDFIADPLVARIMLAEMLGVSPAVGEPTSGSV